MPVLEIIVVQGLVESESLIIFSRNWLMQGSNDPDALTVSLDVNPKEDKLWITLSVHEDDASLDTDHQIKLFTCNNPSKDGFFRYFRIVQHGPTKYKASPVRKCTILSTKFPKGSADVWSQVLVACGFELFGKMKRTVIVKETKAKGNAPKVLESVNVYTKGRFG